MPGLLLAKAGSATRAVKRPGRPANPRPPHSLDIPRRSHSLQHAVHLEHGAYLELQVLLPPPYKTISPRPALARTCPIDHQTDSCAAPARLKRMPVFCHGGKGTTDWRTKADSEQVEASSGGQSHGGSKGDVFIP